MTKNKTMPLGRVIGKIPGDQFIMVRNYLTSSRYADGTANDVIEKVLDYNMELRNAAVYGISIKGKSIAIDVLINED